jgi:hypothetical protein
MTTKLEELQAAYEAAAAKATKATYVAGAVAEAAKATYAADVVAEAVAEAAEAAEAVADDCWEAADELWVAYEAELKKQKEKTDE